MLLILYLVRRVRTITDALCGLSRIVAADLFETDPHDLTQTVRTERLDIGKRVILWSFVVAIYCLRYIETGVY